MVAGYDINGALVKTEFIDGYSTALTGYENCHKLKAFLWDSVSGMNPLAESDLYIKSN